MSTRQEAPGIGRRRLAWALPLTATAIWAVVVIVTGLLGRAVDHWAAALTMLFGSFLAGSSPEGGGAVAFPVLTKGLHVPGEVARTFGLAIQAVGMSMAMATIVLLRRPMHLRALATAGAAAVVGFLGSVALWGEGDEVFWPSAVPTPWIKAIFSIVLGTTALLMVHHDRAPATEPPTRWTGRHTAALVAVGLAGGFLSSLTGTGANIAVFLFLVVLVGVDARIALPTAIGVMTAVSVVGLALFGVADGQLDVTVAGDRVVAVGGEPVDLAASEADLLGLWLAAVPIVVWGAPLGSWLASRVTERTLLRFVAALAAFEVLTTFVLVPELRRDGSLIVFFVGGLLLTPLAILALRSRRGQVFGVDP
ncbi:MAG: sulfite exporter TauE/SafE family protein [Acidimicrobiia bacterium]|nr:sulfite exporter TauE/SafE family protein [Acidimicrobiia bacterium]